MPAVNAFEFFLVVGGVVGIYNAFDRYASRTAFDTYALNVVIFMMFAASSITAVLASATAATMLKSLDGGMHVSERAAVASLGGCAMTLIWAWCIETALEVALFLLCFSPFFGAACAVVNGLNLSLVVVGFISLFSLIATIVITNQHRMN